MSLPILFHTYNTLDYLAMARKITESYTTFAHSLDGWYVPHLVRAMTGNSSQQAAEQKGDP
jgi:hypothetical protein